ncbi:MAG: hypothetical protein JNK33_06150, partial [Candidatus Doudnabacteria bacterium]|nr:hypothetical protein [Candidatus Doudnabacteria bacterium]
MALVVTLAALSTSARAQSTGINACFKGQASAGLGGKVQTDFIFEGIPFLLSFDEYDSGNSVTAYGKFQGKSEEVNELGVFEYAYIPFLTSCDKKNALTKALQKAFPGYKVKFAGDKSKADKAKEGAEKLKDGAVDKGKRIWGKLKEKKP